MGCCRRGGGDGLVWPGAGTGDLDAIRVEIEKRHDEAVRRLREWVRQPSIAAENRGVAPGVRRQQQLKPLVRVLAESDPDVLPA
ncbi:MAG: hypothetical protein ABSD56_02905 [Bryobacteraceae bacterium]